MREPDIRRLEACTHPSRRALLASAAAFSAWAYIPRIAKAAAARDPRFIVIHLRGALDGLAAVAPTGDPDYVSLRGGLALSLGGDPPALPLDGFFALHPAMPVFARLYGQGQAAAVHAVATPYRERSHADGQEVLESGQPRPGFRESGWLNRALAALPRGELVAVRGGLAIGATAPLVLRGRVPVLSGAPLEVSGGLVRGGPALPGERAAAMRRAAQDAARLMAADDGPRIAALAFDGLDTHVAQGGASGRLAQLLAGLDGAFAAFERELTHCWKDTVIVAVSEFGRAVRANAWAGTDHGTGTVALAAGGAIKGGRVIADWPGLADPALLEARDLMPTIDVRAVLGGVLSEHLGLSQRLLASDVFPGSASVRPLMGLIA